MEGSAVGNEEKKSQADGAVQRSTGDELMTCRGTVRALLDHVSSGVAIYRAVNDGQDFVFVEFNRAAQEIEHIGADQVIGRSVAEVFPGIKEFGLFEVLQRVWQSGQSEHHPVSVYKDQRISGWRENYVCKLPSGEIMAIYDDVTSRRRSELVSRVSEQCFRAIADYTYDWEVWVGPAGRVLWTNPAVTRLTGYTVKELVAMQDYPQAVVYQEDRARIGRAFQSALRGSTGNDVEFRIQCKGGAVSWAEMSWQSIYDDKGNRLGHRQSIRDITARKQAEQALEKAEIEKEAILDSLAEHVVYLNADMTVRWANRAACESVRMTRKDVMGRACYDLWAQREQPREKWPVVLAMQTGATAEAETSVSDGRAWFIQASPVRDAEGQITGAVEITLDITQRKLTEEALRQSEEKYRRLAADRP